MAESAVGGREFTLRERRQMGLTITNLASIARELKVEGEIDKDSYRSDMAVAIAVRLESKNSAAFAGVGEQGWEEILAFIERILPLILKLIELFS